MRLPKEDKNEGPSGSVTNQQSLLNTFVREHRPTIHDTYIDDGWSGSSFDHLGFQWMLRDRKSSMRYDSKGPQKNIPFLEWQCLTNDMLSAKMNIVHIAVFPIGPPRTAGSATRGVPPNGGWPRQMQRLKIKEVPLMMTKRYTNASLIYALIAMAGGVFYREFTKFNGFTGKTTLSVVHTHYFLLGMVFFLVLLLLEKSFAFSGAKTGRTLVAYHTGLNITGAALLVRGVTQVLQVPLSSGMDAALSGVAGIGHLLLGVSMVLLLLAIRKKA